MITKLVLRTVSYESATVGKKRTVHLGAEGVHSGYNNGEGRLKQQAGWDAMFNDAGRNANLYKERKRSLKHMSILH